MGLQGAPCQHLLDVPQRGAPGRSLGLEHRRVPGRYGEIWGDMGSYGELWGAAASYRALGALENP